MAKNIEFKGFTPNTFQFLRDLGENNYKEWFEANRSVYETELLHPFKALVLALTPVMYSIDSNFEFRPHRVLSRIYRDTRFSKNKEPYKTCLWITFQQPVSDWKDYPGFYMELSPEGYRYGMGLFMPKKKIMDSFRERIEFDAGEFSQNTKHIVTGLGFGIGGDLYKKPMQNNLDEYFQPWVQRKNVYVQKSFPIGEELFSCKIAENMESDFKALEWLYNFMKDDDLI
ncbi:DUF2461 domain-containing protein [Dysgonomonas sp. 216]|uniref:DUF2461 domain-containing protein n=1 Tax=Dysgonomonas sp. 216 TaxID=2302934 RepID=UPI0013D70F67|nr:DUF2461 domain-containing protein [Dysgonomonas sp. 216]NDW17986.1 DUF2461 domain-containing protein [Dysgonomonas sp. 216]